MDIKILDNEDKVATELLETKHVGLIVMPDRYFEPILICLSTENTIYLLDPTSNNHLKFLKNQLTITEISFYTLYGAFDGCLLKRLGVFPHYVTSHIIDLPTLDAHIQLRHHMMFEGMPTTHYTVHIVHERLTNIRTHSYQELISRWLGKNFNPELNEEQLTSLEMSLEASQSQYAIRKMCQFIRPLGIKMTGKLTSWMRELSDDMFTCAINMSDKERDAYDLREMDNEFEFCMFASMISNKSA